MNFTAFYYSHLLYYASFKEIVSSHLRLYLMYMLKNLLFFLCILCTFFVQAQGFSIDSIYAKNRIQDKGKIDALNDTLSLIYLEYDYTLDTLIVNKIEENLLFSKTKKVQKLFLSGEFFNDKKQRIFILLINVNHLKDKKGFYDKIYNSMSKIYNYPKTLIEDRLGLELSYNRLIAYYALNGRQYKRLKSKISFKGVIKGNTYCYQIFIHKFNSDL